MKPATGQPALDDLNRTSFKHRDAGSYDHLVDEFDRFTERCTSTIANAVAARARVQGASRVLDVGTGTGVLVRAIGRAAPPDVRIVGVDLSMPMLERARRLCASDGSRQSIRFEHADAERLPFDDATFERIVSLYALRHFPDPDAALREMHRCCVPGGQVTIAIGAGAPFPSWAFVRAAVREVRTAVASVAGRHTLEAPRLIDEVITQHSGSGSGDEHASWTRDVRQFATLLRGMLSRAGFRGVEAVWHGHVEKFDDVDDFWMLQLTLSSFARKRLPALTEDIVAKIREDFTSRCIGVRQRGGHLVYRSGALVLTGIRDGSAATSVDAS